MRDKRIPSPQEKRGFSGRVFVLAACRTLVAPKGGALSDESVFDLGGRVIRSLLPSARLTNAMLEVDAVFMGNALAAGGNPARGCALAAGMPETLPALTLDTQCCSGLDAIGLAADAIRSGRIRAAIAGGVESASNAPTRINAQGQAYSQAAFTPWPDRDPNMLDAALALARARGIQKVHEFQWAIQSHSRALKAPHPDRIDPAMDPHARGLDLRLCERAEQHSDHYGYNPCTMAPLADAAATSLLACEPLALEWLRERGGVCVEILSYASCASSPERPGLAAAGLLQWLDTSLTKFGLPRSELDVELMESFAAQAIANTQDLQLSGNQVNPEGGLLAMGHPIGASGAILVGRLTHRLLRRPGSCGLAVISAAGGIASGLLMRSCSASEILC